MGQSGRGAGGRGHLTILENANCGSHVGSSSATGPRIIVVDPRPLTRESVVRLLASSATDFVVLPVSAAEDLGDVMLAKDSVVVLNIGNGRLSEAWVAREIHSLTERLPETPLIVLCDSEDVSQVVEALAYGVRGYIPTTFSPPVAVEAIRLVYAGGTFVPAGALEQATDNRLEGYALPPLAPKMCRADAAATEETVGQAEICRALTPRQQEVLWAICQGEANKTIAYALNLREGTVKVYVRQIMRKLKAKNRTQVALIASALAAKAGKSGR